MKRLIFISIVLVAMLATAHTSYAQGNGKMTVALKGDAEMFTEDGGGTWGIRVDGKVIATPKFTEVKSDDGKYFAVRQDGKWGILDGNGKQLVPCEYATASLVTGTAVLFKNKSDKMPQYFNCKTGEFQQPKIIGDDELHNMVGEIVPGSAAIDYDAIAAEEDIKKLEGWLSYVPEEWAKFELIYDKRRSSLIYKGDTIFSARRIHPAYVTKTKTGYLFYFIIREGTIDTSLYGAYAISPYMKDERVVFENVQTIPYEYYSLEVYSSDGKTLRAQQRPGGNHFLINWNGKKL
ncbi:MAG: WG repeat-containing protein [Prevotellaceae bacterium]|jgi:hypothetical protein|nr:WG repeat-containing protein [Prevotellaceae bacterium]